MSEVVDNTTLPAITGEEDQQRDGEKPSRLLSLTALICGVLRVAGRFSWLDREVVNSTRVLREVLVDLSKDKAICLGFGDNSLSLDDDEITDLPRALRQFHGMARRKAIREIEFGNEITTKETMELLRLLQSRHGLISTEERSRFPHIQIKHDIGESQIELHDGESGKQSKSNGPQFKRRSSALSEVLDQGAETGDEVRMLVADITGAIDTITTARQKKSEGQRANSALTDLASQLDQATEVTLILASLRAHDSYTYDHSINVGLLSIALAKAIGWEGRDLQEFGVAALIHDVGKLYTPLEVLNKPGRFTPQEWVIMRRHPGDGADILREAGVGNELAPRIAIEHHTNPDGTGYPPLPYKDLHTGSKIVKIADCYDAFTTIRPYRSQARPFEVLKMLRKQGGTQFDAELVEAFSEMRGVYPIGSVVQLKSGNIGLVVQTNLDLKDRPVVRVLQDPKRRKPKDIRLIDLAAKNGSSGEFADEITECVDPVIRNIPVGRYI